MTDTDRLWDRVHTEIPDHLLEDAGHLRRTKVNGEPVILGGKYVFFEMDGYLCIGRYGDAREIRYLAVDEDGEPVLHGTLDADAIGRWG